MTTGAHAPSAVGIIGGTFDPIHYGHLIAASEVADQLSLDSVVFVPAGRPWKKGGSGLASAEERYEMTVLATRGDPRFRVDRCDIDRPGPTYTVDTLRDLRDSLGPDARLYLIVGADSREEMSTWRDPEEVMSAAQVLAVSRAGHHSEAPPLPSGSVTDVKIPDMEISSTDIRGRVASGRSIRYLLPEPVRLFILQHGLYQEAP
ncbi:MAG: nicotinate-nucleotide adenylyltransferase [Candidatus Nanopelagicales bacterium]|nr:nicotinate-nucleotide adenylyltransferase [Candidatus Nanopelagicales bacterium]